MPTVTVRPNATTDQSTVGIGGGAGTAHAALSDSSDATYVAWAIGVSTGCYVRLPAPALPAGSRWKTATFSQRIRRTIVSGGQYLLANFTYIDDNVLVQLQPQVITPPSTFTQYSLAPVLIPVGTVGASTYGMNNATGTTDFEVSDVWVDYVYALPPSTDAQAPTGTITDRNVVDVVWVHWPGADGGAQTRYRIKVFSAAQYGAVGFDPETSSATYDSGEVVSTVSTQPTPSLANDTYRSYVKTAQTINGSAHWAPWDFTPFTIDVDTPEVLSVVANPVDDRGAIRFIVTHDTSTATDWQTIEVEASYDGGATWVDVYGAQHVAVILDSWVGYDYTAPIDVAAQYRARASAVVSGQTLTGSWTLSNTASWSSDTVWLKHLSDPTLSQTLCLRDLPNGEDFARTQGVHAVLGRPAYVVTSDVLHTRTGTFSVLTETTAERDELHALLRDGGVLLLQIPESVGGFEHMFIAVGSIGRSRAPGAERAALPHRVHSIPFVEIDRPMLDIAPRVYGETFADALATGGTFATETGTFEELL